MDVCYLPEAAFSQDEMVRSKTFLNEKESHILLSEIGGMIGTPLIDVELLQQRSPDKTILNAYATGKNEPQVYHGVQVVRG